MKKYKIIENNITYDIQEYVNGDKYWYKNGEQHRENGPAVEFADGDKFWYKNGTLHRDAGPAIEWSDDNEQYWYNGKRLKNINSNEELKRYIKLISIY